MDNTIIMLIGFAVGLAVLVTLEAIMLKAEKAELKRLMKRNLAYKKWWKNDTY